MKFFLHPGLSRVLKLSFELIILVSLFYFCLNPGGVDNGQKRNVCCILKSDQYLNEKRVQSYLRSIYSGLRTVRVYKRSFRYNP
jgi:hypothetical protein